MGSSNLSPVAMSASDIRGGEIAEVVLGAFLLTGDLLLAFRFSRTDLAPPTTDCDSTSRICASIAASLAFFTLLSLASDPFLAITGEPPLPPPVSFKTIFVLL